MLLFSNALIFVLRAIDSLQRSTTSSLNFTSLFPLPWKASDLFWTTHVNNMTSRATKTLWVLIRFKDLGASASTQQLRTVYQTPVLTILEFAAPVFHSSLTKDQSMQIERTQKKALAIILGKNYVSYKSALSNLGLERLDVRRNKICYSFSIKCSHSTKQSSMSLETKAVLIHEIPNSSTAKCLDTLTVASHTWQEF